MTSKGLKSVIDQMSASFKRPVNEPWQISGITHKYPSYRGDLIVSTEGWLNSKVIDDAAEGMWRIRDNLYDLSDFAERHPGGAYWIKQTKGTDITEAFESHHIFERANELLPKYKVRAAQQPRNYKFTLHPTGFYMTLKRRVRDKLVALNYRPSRKTDLYHLSLLAALFACSVAAAHTQLLLLKVLAGLALCWLSNAAHNYFHQRDNWQMYTFNFLLFNCNSWRVSHALSHHGYPNSLHDLEMSLFEPFLCLVPNRHLAGKWQRLVSVVISPIVYALMAYVQFFGRLLYSLTQTNIMYWHDLVAFTLPALMYIATGAPLLVVLLQWVHILTIGSFIFGLIGVTAAHHDPRIYHDGDAVRSDRDWGLYQVDTIIDRGDIKGSDFLVLTHYGEHTLHHLFPTLDHAVLRQLYPELLQTLGEFNAELREINHFEHIIGQNRQLLRTEPNPIAPGDKKFK